MSARLLSLLAAPALCLSLASCLNPLDSLGQDSTDVDISTSAKASTSADDQVADKHPAYVEDRWVSDTFGECEVPLNKSGSVAKLDVVPFSQTDKSLDGKLFKDRGAAIAAASQFATADLLPSMEVVNGRMKGFNDGLYAAVEMGMQEGVANVFDGKQKFLADLLAAVTVAATSATPAQKTALDDAAAFLGAAMILGGQTPALSSELLQKAQANVASFQVDTLSSRPIGFYTWSPALEQVFAQDRFLQNRLGTLTGVPVTGFGTFVALAAVLKGSPALTQQYERLLSVYTGMTARYASYTAADLLPIVTGLSSIDDGSVTEPGFLSAHPEPFVCRGSWFGFVPASRAKDSDYLSGTYCLDDLPATFQPLDALIAAIQSGALDLTPGADAGWYDWQLYSLETLLVPQKGAESDHLLLTAAYKKKLVETFKSLITQYRETHVKQVAGFAAQEASNPGRVVVVNPYPLYPVEPFSTFYLRTARAYRFIETFLKASLGEPFLASSHRLFQDHVSAQALGEELHQMTELLYGLYFLSSQSVGLDPQAQLMTDELAGIVPEDCLAHARTWLAGWQTDSEVLEDPRFIVPQGSSNGRTFYSATIGIKVYRISAEYVAGYLPKVGEPHPVGGEYVTCTFGGFQRHDYFLLAEDTVQVSRLSSQPPPTRDELRALCDQHQTEAAIIAALEAP
ncbi:MAG: hypothetical protein QM765_26415 [Myxococcales bacterium]